MSVQQAKDMVVYFETPNDVHITSSIKMSSVDFYINNIQDKNIGRMTKVNIIECGLRDWPVPKVTEIA